MPPPARDVLVPTVADICDGCLMARGSNPKKPEPKQSGPQPPRAQPQGPVLPTFSAMAAAVICDRLEKGARATIPIFVVTERLLIGVGCFLLLAIFVPLGQADAKTLLGLGGAGLNSLGAVVYRMHIAAVKSAELWAGMAAAYRDPNITENDLQHYNDILHEHLKNETRGGGWRGMEGLIKRRGHQALPTG
jgi:hypothetical protein